MAYVILSLLVILFGGVFLFFFANPIGWIVVGLGAFGLVVWTAIRVFSPEKVLKSSRKHGDEDRSRGPSDDQMYK